MLLGARQFFERRGAPMPPLPYDAEVEYLESTGTQWIRTNIAPSIGDILSVDTTVQLSSNVASDTWITGWYGGASLSTLIGTYQSRFHFTYNTDGNKTTSGDGIYSKHRIKFNFPEGILIDDNVISSSVAANTPLTAVPSNFGGLCVFARNYGGSGANIIRAKIFSFIVRINETVVFDGHPVRFTNEQGVSEGAMYDRVSGQLFRNAGTGAFTIGPDKTSWTNPYITDGLVAMWDGEWNAGGGVHDASATTWVDLISGNNMLLEGNAAFSSNSLSVDASSRAYSSSPITSVGTLEICMSRSDSNTDVCLFALNSLGGLQMRNFVSWYGGKLGFSESNARTDVCLSVSRPWSATTFAFVPSTGAVYANGVAQTGASETFYYSSAQNLVGVSINPSVQAQRMAGSWHSVRVYSRTLSAAEIAANYAIDKARFNLP